MFLFLQILLSFCQAPFSILMQLRYHLCRRNTFPMPQARNMSNQCLNFRECHILHNYAVLNDVRLGFKDTISFGKVVRNQIWFVDRLLQCGNSPKDNKNLFTVNTTASHCRITPCATVRSRTMQKKIYLAGCQFAYMSRIWFSSK